MTDSDLSRERLLELLQEAEAAADALSNERVSLRPKVLRALVQMALRVEAKDAREVKTARATMQRQTERVQAALLSGSSVPEIQERAQCVQRKLDVDEQLKEMKKKLGRAKLAVHEKGEYLPPREFRRLEEKIEELKNESQALQFRLGELRRTESEQNRQATADINERFFKTAHHRLPPELFEEIKALAEQHGDDS